MTSTTPAEVREAVERVISEAEVLRVHGHANFGTMSPREVVDDGVRKYAVGYHSGHTQLCILLEHGLITKPRPGSYDARLTKKGRSYFRALYNGDLAELARLTCAVETRSDGDLLWYDMGEGVRVRCTYRGDCEGWPLVTFDADRGSDAPQPVRPSRVRARTALSRTQPEDQSK